MKTSHRIIIGDVLDGLRSLDAGSCRCCVTSPPYWGLRDYGTASWVGGDAACDHVQRTNKHGGTCNRPGIEAQTYEYRTVCGKCGALRVDQQIGLEATPDEYVARIVAVFREVRRVLADDGTLWLNLGDSYASSTKSDDRTPEERSKSSTLGPKRDGLGGSNAAHIAVSFGTRRVETGLKPKDLCGIPWRVAFALQADGWWLRQDIVWCLSGGTWLYVRTQKGDMPMTVKDLSRLDPATVQLWNGEK